MSKTMTEDARMFVETGSDRLVLGGSAPSIATAHRYEGRTILGPTLLQDECDHSDLNAHGTRCLKCGVWAHEFIQVLIPATSLMK